MSGALRTGGAVSIPPSVRKTIQDIKEIAGNHSDDEIYAMLKECNMDPNETAQKLLYQDPFHEVKRKRDKRKEQNTNSRDSGETRSRPANQGRGGRGGGRGNYLPRYISYDAGGGRGSNMARENGGYQIVNKAGSNNAFPPTISQNVQTKTNSPGTLSLPASTSGTSVIANGSSADAHSPENQTGSWSPGTGQSVMADVLKSSSVQQSSTQPPRAPTSTSVTVQGQSIGGCQQYIPSVTPTSVSGVYSSSSDPVLVPKLNSRVSGAVGTIKREVGTVGAERVVAEQATGSVDNKPASASSFPNTLQMTKSDVSEAADSEVKVSENEISASTTVHSFSQERVVSKSQTKDGDHLSDMQPQVSASPPTGYSVSRSSVMGNHYNIRTQQLIGSQKAVGPNKEWKPKPTNQNVVPSPGIIGTSTVSNSTSEVSRSPSPAAKSTLEDTSSKVQKNLEELNIRDEQHVIIPNHLQVPEAERTGLSFGSFDANFDANFGTNYSASYGNDDDSDKSSTPLSEESQVPEETIEEPSSSISNTTPVTPNEDYPHHQRTSVSSVDNLSSANDLTVSTNPTIVSQSDPSKPDVVVQPGPQYSLVQTAPNYSGISLMPQMINSQYPSYEHTEPQLRDVSRLPFVQPAYDPSTSYYTPIFRPSSDGDARFSQFLGSTAASKYNGNVTILSGQSVPSSQESGNSLVLSNTGPTALGTQAAGIVQTTIALPQQPIPMFRQPTGVHISHYPPNYLPYHQFFSPFYLPSPTMHNIVGNSGFPQLPAGSSYPAAAGSSYPPAAAAGSSYPPAAAAVKYSLSQYKPGTASGNSPHIGVPAGYGSYTAAPSGYSASPAVTAGNNASGCDDIGGSQYKENNVYIAGQQGEGSTVWFQGPPRDLAGMQANSYYNLPPPQGQHMAFTHAQGGHATYAGLYHPTQSGPAPNAHPLLQQTQTLGGAVGVVGAQAGVYQQPQRAQLNWANSY